MPFAQTHIPQVSFYLGPRIMATLLAHPQLFFCNANNPGSSQSLHTS